MNAKDLFDIVKDLPRDAWPVGIMGWNFERGYVLYQVPTMGSEPTVMDIFLWPDQAALMFEASMVRRLIENSVEHPSVWHEIAEGGVCRYRVTGSHGWDSFDVNGPTLLHALAAAVRAVANGGQHGA